MLRSAESQKCSRDLLINDIRWCEVPHTQGYRCKPA